MGEVADVADGYARNYLLPRKLAVEITPASLEVVGRAREAKLKRERDELERVQDVARRLDGFLCYIQARATEEGHLYGSVGAEQVAETLVRSGFETIRPANIVMSQHLEQVGDCELEVMLHPEVRVRIMVRVAPLEEEQSEG
jgi:large subunit ribosomal protein L9